MRRRRDRLDAVEEDTSISVQRARMRRPKPPYFVAVSAVFSFACLIASVTSQRGPIDVGSAYAEPIEISSKSEITLEAELRRLKAGSASGTGSLFWLNGQRRQDYPYSCKCDPGKYAEWVSHNDQLPEPNQKGASWGIFKFPNFNKAPPENSSRVTCSGHIEKNLLSFSDPFCDAHNAASPYGMTLSYNWRILTVVILTLHYICYRVHFH